ncbi:MAG: SDR family oxidoreductase [Bacteroidia bacterium]|nr:SDR family oxidoreductase [Bacteroidia bacterium]
MNIIVTGVSRGIGYETARHLVLGGHHVLGISRNAPDLAERLQREMPGARFEMISFDLEKGDMESLVEQKVKKIFPKVHALVNNAGLLVSRPFEQISSAELRRVFEVNVFSVFRLIQYLVPLMEGVITVESTEVLESSGGERLGERLSLRQQVIQARGAHIVNISSMGGITGTAKFAGLSAYSSSKGALSILTECLAVELQKKNISVNGIAPGAVQTEMLAQAFPGFKAPVNASQMGEFIADFTVNGHKYFNGKVLPVSLSTP